MARARIPIVRKLKTLPSGPTVPPVSHLAPCKEAFDRCPSKTTPLFGTEYKNVSPKSKLACHPTTNQRLPARRKANAKISPIDATPAAPTQRSRGCPKGTAQNEHESTTAAGQNPMPSPSVYCVYPRNRNSSNKPTKRKKTAQSIPQRRSSPPCTARPPKEYPPKAAINPTNAHTSTNPIRQPCQNNFPNAPLSGKPYTPTDRPSICAIISAAPNTTLRLNTSYVN